MLACVVDLIFVAGGRVLPAGQDTLDHLGTSG